MRKTSIGISLLALFVTLVVATASFAEAEKGDSLNLGQLPAAVQKTVGEQTKDGKVDKIEKKSEGEMVSFAVKFTKGSRKLAIEVASDGELLTTEEEVTLAQVPAAVQKTLKERAAEGTIKKIKMITVEGGMNYEAVVITNGKKRTISVDPAGAGVPNEGDKGDVDD